MSLKRFFPAFIKDYIKKGIITEYKKIELKNYLKAEKPFYCPVCNTHITNFETIDNELLRILDEKGFNFSIFQFETLNIFSYSCPICKSTDRLRLITLFYLDIQKKLNNNRIYSFLDIAPSSQLSKIIKSNPQNQYRTADLYREDVDDNIDIQNMSIYKNEMFDFIICSHVLEHINDDNKAISELYRILKNEGLGILLVPILLNIENDIENSIYNTDDLRWKYYAQNDHVRQYSKQGFIKKLEKTGFKVEQVGVDYFGNDVFLRNGINNKSVLYIVKK